MIIAINEDFTDEHSNYNISDGNQLDSRCSNIYPVITDKLNELKANIEVKNIELQLKDLIVNLSAFMQRQNK